MYHPYPFPQPAFASASKRVSMMSNPQKLLVNGLVIEVLNADVFSDMESCMVPAPKGSLDQTIQAMLEQKSLYPIFPPASADFPVEYHHEDHFLLNDIPDILLVQSTQPCFVHVRFADNRARRRITRARCW